MLASLQGSDIRKRSSLIVLSPDAYPMTFWALGGPSAPLTNSSLSPNSVNLSVCGRTALGPGTVSGRQAAFRMGQSPPRKMSPL